MMQPVTCSRETALALDARPYGAMEAFAANRGEKLNPQEFITILDDAGDCWLLRLDPELHLDNHFQNILARKRGVVR